MLCVASNPGTVFVVSSAPLGQAFPPGVSSYGRFTGSELHPRCFYALLTYILA